MPKQTTDARVIIKNELAKRPKKQKKPVYTSGDVASKLGDIWQSLEDVCDELGYKDSPLSEVHEPSEKRILQTVLVSVGAAMDQTLVLCRYYDLLDNPID